MKVDVLKKRQLWLRHLFAAVLLLIFGAAVYAQHAVDKGAVMTILCYVITCMALITITFIPDIMARRCGSATNT